MNLSVNWLITAGLELDINFWNTNAMCNKTAAIPFCQKFILLLNFEVEAVCKTF